ncbi:lytic transglycosylase domain-containing protein [Thermodesulfitimonas autotrophica]|uniref:lytic transglycosylase domain-containing protein n=1 Tax=Thermodesulfitimonas autotrophica TaxID=1894989 RepID=UPI002FE26A1F
MLVKVQWGTEVNNTNVKGGGSTGPAGFTAALEAAARQDGGLEELFAAAAARFGVRAELLRAVARVESGFNPRAVSRAGAQGIMQLMPDTTRALGVRDPFNPAENIFAGAAYLRSLLDRFGGDEALALAAYNAGPGAVARYGGIPPYAETRAYVAKVLQLSGCPAEAAPSADAGGQLGIMAVKAEKLVPGGPVGDEETLAGETEKLSALALVWRYALAEYLLHTTTGEEKPE